MHFRIQLVVIEDNGTEHAQEIADLTRTEASIETLGLLLTESKHVLQTLQCAIIAHQVAVYLAQKQNRRFGRMVRPRLGHYPELRTPPLPVTHVRIGNRLEHSPGGGLSSTSLGKCDFVSHA